MKQRKEIYPFKQLKVMVIKCSPSLGEDGGTQVFNKETENISMIEESTTQSRRIQ